MVKKFTLMYNYVVICLQMAMLQFISSGLPKVKVLLYSTGESNLTFSSLS